MTQEIQHDRQILVMEPTPGGPISRKKLRSVINHPLQENTEFGFPGSGWNTHSKDAKYQLDRDGNIKTIEDRKDIAIINQQLLANGKGMVISKPLWSGLQDCGVQEFNTSSKILISGGQNVQPLPPT